jgi:hypothetical protein
MAYKLCQNHLTELYEAIKRGDIGEIEEVEHELSSQEECVACAYALKAKGEAKKELLGFLKSEGFAVEVPEEKGPASRLAFWLVRIGIFALVFFAFWLPLKNFLNTPIIFLIAFIFGVLVFVVLEQFLS